LIIRDEHNPLNLIAKLHMSQTFVRTSGSFHGLKCGKFGFLLSTTVSWFKRHSWYKNSKSRSA